ncbi:sensor histidine kinase [Pararhodospirillum photometricum]|uniref:sensor histidine kinase n=1 Tax=Pararhodospirillum photometricum TaxID=1084 RepID=UPI0005A03F4B|nr:HAMP domain-containing sensor histidine kinase [Pararhodospirillum photometricum]
MPGLLWGLLGLSLLGLVLLAGRLGDTRAGWFVVAVVGGLCLGGDPASQGADVAFIGAAVGGSGALAATGFLGRAGGSSGRWLVAGTLALVGLAGGGVVLVAPALPPSLGEGSLFVALVVLSLGLCLGSSGRGVPRLTRWLTLGGYLGLLGMGASAVLGALDPQSRGPWADWGLGAALMGCVFFVLRCLAEDRIRISAQESFFHEVRAPLAILRSTIDLLELHLIARELPRPLGRLHRAVNRLADLLEPDSIFWGGRARVTPLVLRQVVEEAVTLARLVSPERVVVVEDQSDDALIAGERPAMVTAFVNIIENALKYSAAQSVVQVVLERTSDRRSVMVQVVDHGMGIAPDAVSRVFQPTYRAPGTQAIPGTGMGLFLAREMIEHHAGTIDLQSQPAQGTRVLVCLPLLEARPMGQPEGMQES